MKLAERQKVLARWVLDPDAKGTPEGLAPIADLSAEEGAALYRSSILEAEINALMIAFPAALDLVGETFFRFASKSFLRGGFVQDGDLDRLADGFPAFLETVPGVEQTPYLTDVCRLELAVNKAVDGPDSGVSGATDWQRLSDDPVSVRLHLNANATLIESRFPVHKIRAACLSGFENKLDLSAATDDTHLIVFRPALELVIEELERDDWVFLNAVSREPNFVRACENACAANPDIEIAHVLSRAAANHWLAPTGGETTA